LRAPFFKDKPFLLLASFKIDSIVSRFSFLILRTPAGGMVRPAGVINNLVLSKYLNIKEETTNLKILYISFNKLK
jgi:hypothetical protein